MKCLFYFLILISICFLFVKIDIELEKEVHLNSDLIIKTNQKFFNKIKSYPHIGWFKLDEQDGYIIGNDFRFVYLQYVIAPTILENRANNKIIICYYTSPKQLDAFCKKNKKYRIIEKGFLTNLALLERNTNDF